MSTALHLHLILVHIPIVLYPLSVLLLVIFCIRKDKGLMVIASLIIISATSVAIGGYLTGEGAEEVAENLPGVLKSTIESHEDSAVISLWLSCITAALALLAIYPRLSERLLRHALATLVLFASASSLSFFWVGYQGGKIRHPEAYLPVENHKSDHD